MNALKTQNFDYYLQPYNMLILKPYARKLTTGYIAIVATFDTEKGLTVKHRRLLDGRLFETRLEAYIAAKEEINSIPF